MKIILRALIIGVLAAGVAGCPNNSGGTPGPGSSNSQGGGGGY